MLFNLNRNQTGILSSKSDKMRTIIVTGPECSGKSTLAQQLSFALDGVYVPEIARPLLTLTGNRYTFNDLVTIGHYQSALGQSAKGLNKEWVILDTSMLVLKIWSLYRYNAVDPWIDRVFAQTDAHLWLLCTPLPDWHPDELRVNQYERDHLFNRYRDELQKAGKSFLIVPPGSADERLQQVLKHTTGL